MVWYPHSFPDNFRMVSRITKSLKTSFFYCCATTTLNHPTSHWAMCGLDWPLHGWHTKGQPSCLERKHMHTTLEDQMIPLEFTTSPWTTLTNLSSGPLRLHSIVVHKSLYALEQLEWDQNDCNCHEKWTRLKPQLSHQVRRPFLRRPRLRNKNRAAAVT